MRRALGWMCWQIVMAWPSAWPSGAVAGWILAWAGDYANEPPNLEFRPGLEAEPEGIAPGTQG